MKKDKSLLRKLYKDAYLTDFLQTLKSDGSKVQYENEILTLCECFNCLFQKIDYKKANTYIQGLRERAGKGEITYKRARSLFYYFNSYGIYLQSKLKGYQNPFYEMTAPAVTEDISPVCIPSDSEIEQMLRKAYHSNDKQAFMMMLLSYRCAMTTVELISLKKEHVTYEEGWYMLALTKERFITLPKDVNPFFEQYLKSIVSGYLFKNKYGRKLSHRTADNLIKRSLAGVVEDFSLRDYTLKGIRKAGILNMLDGSEDIQVASYAGLSAIQLRNYKKAYEMRGETAADRSPIKVTE